MYLYYTPASDNTQLNFVSLWDNKMSKEHLFMNIMSNIAERLKDLMDEAGINITVLAERTGVDSSVISRILKCERMPSTQTVVTLADFFGCTTDSLLGLSDFCRECTFKPRPPFSERLNFLLSNFHVTKYRLEKDTKLTEATVDRWQKGKYEPTVESIIRLAEYFDCSVDFILGREN